MRLGPVLESGAGGQLGVTIDDTQRLSVKTLLDLIDTAEQSFSTNAQPCDAAYSRLHQYKVEVRGIRDMLEVPNQPSYIDPCRDTGDVVDAVASTYSAAQERAFSALRSPVGPNNILQNAQGLSTGAQHRLASHEGIQEDLTDQMVSLASKLKQQAHAQARALHERDAVLDSASQGLLKSVQGVQTVVKDTKQAVKRTRRSMFFSFFILLSVAAVFLGVYGYINVTAVTKMFVPYNTIASQWMRNNAQAAKQLRHGAQQESPLPPKSSVVTEPPITDVEADLAASGEDFAMAEPLEGTTEQRELSRSARFETVDSGDDGDDSTQQDSADRDTPVAHTSDRSQYHVRHNQAVEEAVEGSNYFEFQQPRDQAQNERGHYEDQYAYEEDEHSDDNPVADANDEQGRHGTVQPENILVNEEEDAQEPSSKEDDDSASQDELKVPPSDKFSGATDVTAVYETGPAVQDSSEAHSSRPQAVMPQDETSGTSSSSESLSVQDIKVQDTEDAEAVSSPQEQPELALQADPEYEQCTEESGKVPGALPQGDAAVQAGAARLSGQKIVHDPTDATTGRTRGNSADPATKQAATSPASVLTVGSQVPVKETDATLQPAALGSRDMPAPDAPFTSAGASVATPDTTTTGSSDADSSTVQNLTLADTTVQLHRQFSNAPKDEHSLTEGVEGGDLPVGPLRVVGQDSGMAAAGKADDVDEYYDPPEVEEPAAVHAADQEEDEDEDDEDNDEEEEDEDLDVDEDDEYYDEPESLEDSSPAQANMEHGIDPVASDASGECSATDSSGCKAVESPVQDAHEVFQAARWDRTEVGGKVEQTCADVDGDSVNASCSYDSSSADSAVASRPGPQRRDEL